MFVPVGEEVSVAKGAAQVLDRRVVAALAGPNLGRRVVVETEQRQQARIPANRPQKLL
jgi:hypothetical protein